MSYRVKPIPAEITADVRKTLTSPQYKSLRAVVSVANGYGPCRSCLKVFDEDREERICFTYNSFDGRADLPNPGPVFIHRGECEEFSGDGLPTDLLRLPIFFEAFGDESRLISRLPMNSAEADIQIRTIFADANVQFINVRNADAGCFIAAVERK